MTRAWSAKGILFSQSEVTLSGPFQWIHSGWMPSQIHLLSKFQFIRATLLCWTLVMKQNIYTSKETTMFHSSWLVYLPRWSCHLTDRKRKGTRTRIGRPIHPCFLAPRLPGCPGYPLPSMDWSSCSWAAFHLWTNRPITALPASAMASDLSRAVAPEGPPGIPGNPVTVSTGCPLVWKAKWKPLSSELNFSSSSNSKLNSSSTLHQCSLFVNTHLTQSLRLKS